MASELIDSLMEQLNALSAQEKRLVASRLLEQAKDEEQAQILDLPDEVRYRRREYQWIKEHGGAYAGQWIALEGDKLFAHGSTAREVLNEAKKAGAKFPFIAKMDSPEDLYFTGGW
jgi:hypothetical protein